MPGRSRSYIWLVSSLIVITSFSAWASLQCWPAQIGCHQPRVVGWPNFLNLFLTLELGPLAPWYMMLVGLGPQAPLVPLNTWLFLIASTVLGLLPWVIHVRTKGRTSLVIGTALWTFFGWMFGIGLWT